MRLPNKDKNKDLKRIRTLPPLNQPPSADGVDALRLIDQVGGRVEFEEAYRLWTEKTGNSGLIFRMNVDPLRPRYLKVDRDVRVETKLVKHDRFDSKGRLIDTVEVEEKTEVGTYYYVLTDEGRDVARGLVTDAGDK